MPYLRFPLRTVSPLLLKGTNNYVELRAPSIIGQLRFWLRAILGAQVSNSEEIYRLESALLGSTSTASSVTMQVSERERELAVGDFRVLPHSSQKTFEETAFKEEGFFDLKLIVRPGTILSPQISHALSLWLLLGGVGKRSRRMFGSIQLSSYPRPSRDFELDEQIYPEWWSNWEQIEQRPNLFAKLISLSVRMAFASQPPRQMTGNEPDFPVLHPACCRIIIGQKGFRSAEAANIALFEVIRKSEYRKNEYMFGSGSPRRASPLIAQVREFNGELYPVLTAFRSPVSRYPQWDVVDAALDELKEAFNGVEIDGFDGRLNR